MSGHLANPRYAIRLLSWLAAAVPPKERILSGTKAEPYQRAKVKAGKSCTCIPLVFDGS